MRNRISSLPYSRIDPNTIEVNVTMEPLESFLIVFQDKARSLPPRLPDIASATQVIPLAGEHLPVAAATLAASPWEGASWFWYPEGNPAITAPPGNCCLRGSFTVAADRAVRSAGFVITADNEFSVWVNGHPAAQRSGDSEAWRTPYTVDITPWIRAGLNHIAVLGGNSPGIDGGNPAGVIGHYTVDYASGSPLKGRIDSTWKAMNRVVDGWNKPEFDDQSWPSAQAIARHGDAPWGHLDRLERMTLSPVVADPYLARCEIPAGLDLSKSRVVLELEGVTPEEAARITINETYVGGFIGRPLRLDVTLWLRSGANTIRVDPFAPKQARLVVF
jgi:hypothetical protein